MNVLYLILDFVIGCIAGLAADWLVSTRLAAYRSDYEYIYAPSTIRYTLIAAIVALLVYLFEIDNPSHPWLPGIAIAGVAFVIYGQLAVRDVSKNLIPTDSAEQDR